MIINRLIYSKKFIYFIFLIFDEESVLKSIFELLLIYVVIFFDVLIKIGKKKNMFKDVFNRINEELKIF